MMQDPAGSCIIWSAKFNSLAATAVAARLLMKDPHTTLMSSKWSANVDEQQETFFVACKHLWSFFGGCRT